MAGCEKDKDTFSYKGNYKTTKSHIGTHNIMECDMALCRCMVIYLLLPATTFLPLMM